MVLLLYSLCLLLALFAGGGLSVDLSYTAEEFQEYLEKAAEKVVQQHLYHSHYPDDNAREEMEIFILARKTTSSIKDVISWLYLDGDMGHIFLGRTASQIFVWYWAELEPLEIGFVKETAAFHLELGDIKDAILFNHHGVKLAILMPSNIILYSWESDTFKEEERSDCMNSLKILQVNGQLIVISSSSSTAASFIRRNNYLEVLFPNLVDATAFSFGDESYIVLGNDSIAEVYKLGRFPKLVDSLKEIQFLEKMLTFWTGSDFFLFFAGQMRQILQAWFSEELAYIGDIQRTSPSHYLAFQFPTCKQEAVLAAFDYGGSVDLYKWKRKRFDGKQHEEIDARLGTPAPIAFVHKTSVYLMVPLEKSAQVHLLKLKCEHKMLMDPYLLSYYEAPSQLQGIFDKLKHHNDLLKSIMTALESAVNSYSLPRYKQTFKQITSFKFGAKETLDNYKIFLENDVNDFEMEKLISLEASVFQLGNEIDSLIKIMKGAIYTDKDWHFEEQVVIHDATIGTLSAEDVDSSFLQLPQLYSDGESVALTINGELNVWENLDVEDTINGVRLPTDILLTSGDQQIIEGIRLESPKAQSLTVAGKLNGISPDQIITFNNQPEFLALDQVYVEDLSSDQSGFVNTSLLKHGSQEIKGTKHFKGKSSFKELIVPHIDLNVVRRDKPSSISGTKTLANHNYFNSIEVEGTFDNLRIPNDLISTENENNIYGIKRIKEINAAQVFAEKLVDEIELDDVVTLSGNEEMGEEIFESGLDVLGNLFIHGNLDGMQPESLLKGQVTKASDVTFIHDVYVLGDVIVRGNIPVVKDLNDEAIYIHGQDVHIPNHVIFTEPVAMNSLTTPATVSVLNPLEYFLTSGNQRITGTKTFQNALYVEGNMGADYSIDGVDIAELHQTLAHGFVKGNLAFPDEVHVYEDLVVQGLLDGINVPNELVLTSGASLPLIGKTFSNGLSAVEMAVDDVLHNILLDNVNIDELDKSRVTLGGEQVLYGDYILGDTWASNVASNNYQTFPSLAKQHTPNVINSTKFFTEVWVDSLEGLIPDPQFLVRKDRNSEFRLPQVIQSLDVRGSIIADKVAGIQLEDLDSESVKKSGHQKIGGVVVFKSGLEITGNAEIISLNNGRYILNQALFADQGNDFLGRLTADTIVIEGNSQVEGTVGLWELDKIDKVVVMKDAPANLFGDLTVKVGQIYGDLTSPEGPHFATPCLRLDEQIVPGRKTIKDEVHVFGDFNVDSVNGHPWFEPEDIVLIQPSKALRASVLWNEVEVKSFLKIKEDVEVGGKVCGADISEFAATMVRRDRPVTINGNKTLTGLISLEGPLNSLINNVDLARDAVRVRSVSQDGLQEVTGPMIFHGVNFEADLLVDDGRINEQDLKTLLEDSLMFDGDQTFEGNVTIKGETWFKDLNTPKLKDLVPLDSEQDLSGSLTFKDHLVLQGNLRVDGFVHQLDFTSLPEYVLYLDGDKEVDVAMSFNHVTELEGISAPILELDTLLDQVKEFQLDYMNTVGLLEELHFNHSSFLNRTSSRLQKTLYLVEQVVERRRLNFTAAHWLEVHPEDDMILVANNRDNEMYQIDIGGNLVASHPEIPETPFVQGDGHFTNYDKGSSLVVNGGLTYHTRFQVKWAELIGNKLVILSEDGFLHVATFHDGTSRESTYIYAGPNTRAVTLYSQYDVYSQYDIHYLVAVRQEYSDCSDSALFRLEQPIVGQPGEWRKIQSLPVALDVITFYQDGTRMVALADAKHVILYRTTHCLTRPLYIVNQTPFLGVRRLAHVQAGMRAVVAAASDDFVKIYVLRGESGLDLRSEFPTPFSGPIVGIKLFKSNTIRLALLGPRQLVLYEILPYLL